MEAVVKADKRLIESSFNRKILPALAAIGFLKPGLRLEITKEVDLEKLWKMTYEASQNYDVDPEWIRDTFGIAVIGKKQQGLLPPGADGGAAGRGRYGRRCGRTRFFRGGPAGRGIRWRIPHAAGRGARRARGGREV